MPVFPRWISNSVTWPLVGPRVQLVGTGPDADVQVYVAQAGSVGASLQDTRPQMRQPANGVGSENCAHGLFMEAVACGSKLQVVGASLLYRQQPDNRPPGSSKAQRVEQGCAHRDYHKQSSSVCVSVSNKVFYQSLPSTTEGAQTCLDVLVGRQHPAAAAEHGATVVSAYTCLQPQVAS